MAKSVANVVIATDSFGTLVGITNQLAYAMTAETITANTSPNGANTTGNSFVIGTFSANTIAVPTSLRGGFVNAAANLNITSNAVFTGATAQFTSNVNTDNAVVTINTVSGTIKGGSLAVSSNTSFTANVSTSGNRVTLDSFVTTTGSNTFINSTGLAVYSNTVSITSETTSISSNVTFNNSVTFGSSISFNNDIVLGSIGRIHVEANTDIGTDTVSPTTIYSFLKSSYRTGKVIVQTTNSGEYQSSELMVVHDGTDAYMTAYATVASPNTANLGVLSVSSNTSHVLVNLLQVTPSSSVKIIANLIS